MKKILQTLCIITIICFNGSMHGMKRKKSQIKETQTNQIPAILQIPQELLVNIIGLCKPEEKNELMKVCKDFNALLKNRELILCANPFTVSMKDRQKGMFEYASSGNIEMIDFLLNIAHTSLHLKNSLGMTPLHYAMEKDHDNVVQFLIKHGANAHKSKPKIYPLHDAVYKGNKEYVENLLALKVDLNSTLKNGNTPLTIAILEGHTEIAELLHAAGVHKKRDSDDENEFDRIILKPISAKSFRKIIERQQKGWY